VNIHAITIIVLEHIINTAGILMGSPEKRGRQYQAMAVNLGYLDTAPDIGDALTSRKNSMNNSENNKARKQKTTSQKNRNKKTDTTKKGEPKDDSNADKAEGSSQEEGKRLLLMKFPVRMVGLSTCLGVCARLHP
jgi:hypothetical protein